jgi:hypothetical protein
LVERQAVVELPVGDDSSSCSTCSGHDVAATPSSFIACAGVNICEELAGLVAAAGTSVNVCLGAEAGEGCNICKGISLLCLLMLREALLKGHSTRRADGSGI